MNPVRSVKGKKRARESVDVPDDTSTSFNSRTSSSSLSPVPDDPTPAPVAKKPKHAETRPCPACSEHIPIRLLAAHAELELQRVEDIIRHVGDAEVLAEVDDLEEGPSSSKRRSALKARQSLTALQPLPRTRVLDNTNTNTSPAAIEHTIANITRRRKARHTRLKELSKEDATWLVGASGREEIVCPVCALAVRGDRDVVEAHVDACLTYESRRAQVEHEGGGHATSLTRGDEDANVDVDVDAGSDVHAGGGNAVRTRIITNASLRGTGIHIRPSTMDTEDDIDIDGTDDAVFGDAQFREADVLRPDQVANATNVEGEDEKVESVGERSNHERQTSESSSQSRPQDSDIDTDKLDLAILAARSRGDQGALTAALEAKLNAIPATLTCRICLCPYVDPTVSTGCWHTCCATCWLRCLGATKLCPMCQRITGASELRRVYL